MRMMCVHRAMLQEPADGSIPTGARLSVRCGARATIGTVLSFDRRVRSGSALRADRGRARRWNRRCGSRHTLSPRHAVRSDSARPNDVLGSFGDVWPCRNARVLRAGAPRDESRSDSGVEMRVRLRQELMRRTESNIGEGPVRVPFECGGIVCVPSPSCELLACCAWLC